MFLLRLDTDLPRKACIHAVLFTLWLVCSPQFEKDKQLNKTGEQLKTSSVFGAGRGFALGF